MKSCLLFGAIVKCFSSNFRANWLPAPELIPVIYCAQKKPFAITSAQPKGAPLFKNTLCKITPPSSQISDCLCLETHSGVSPGNYSTQTPCSFANLWMQVINLNVHQAGMQLNCPQLAALELWCCKIAATLEQDPFSFYTLVYKQRTIVCIRKPNYRYITVSIYFN